MRMRRMRNRWGLFVLCSAVLLAGGLLAVEASGAASKPPASTRYVALGDSVPYGHGLNNPYTTAQIGLPQSAVSQGPSSQAWPSLVQGSLKLTMSVQVRELHALRRPARHQRGTGLLEGREYKSLLPRRPSIFSVRAIATSRMTR